MLNYKCTKRDLSMWQKITKNDCLTRPSNQGSRNQSVDNTHNKTSTWPLLKYTNQTIFMMREAGSTVQYKNRQGSQKHLNSIFGAKQQFRIDDSNQSHPGASAWHCVGLLSYQSSGERQWRRESMSEKDARDCVIRGECRHERIEETKGKLKSASWR